MVTEATGLYLTLVTALGFVTLLLLMYAWSVWHAYRNRMAEHREQLSREIGLMETERSRIAADLHDELGSGLAAIGLFARQAAETCSHPALKKLIINLPEQQQKLREISFNLSPRILETHGLTMALKEMAEDMCHGARINLSFHGNADHNGADPSRTVHLYRVVREMLNNTVKHAHATRCTLTLARQDTQLMIVVEDNGHGFAADTLHMSSGSGLHNIRTRMELLNARWMLCQPHGGGTRYEITVPLISLTKRDGDSLQNKSAGG